MATPTYTLIDSVTTTANASTVGFSSIDQSYRDLVLVFQGRPTSAQRYVNVRFNGAGNTHRDQNLTADGSTIGTHVSSGSEFELRSATSSVPASLVMHIMDYSQTDRKKIFVARTAAIGDSMTSLNGGTCNDLSALTTVDIFFSGRDVLAGAQLFLYGIEG